MKISISKLRSMLITCTAMHGGIARQPPRHCIFIHFGSGSIKLLYMARDTKVAIDHAFGNMDAKPVHSPSIKVRVGELNAVLRTVQDAGNMQVDLLINKTHLILDTPTLTRTIKRRDVEEKMAKMPKAKVLPFVTK